MMQTVIILILVGSVLLLLETVLPGMIAGILGLCCLFAGVVLGFVYYGFQTGITLLTFVFIGLIIGTLVWIKYFPGSRMAKMFISNRSIGTLGVEKPDLLNQTGVASTTLRPSGVALINGQRIDVVSEGNMIERGMAIKVVAVEGARIVVRAV